MKNRIYDSLAFSLVIGVPCVIGLFDSTTIVGRIAIVVGVFMIAWMSLTMYDHMGNVRKMQRVQWFLGNLNFTYIHEIGFNIVDKMYLFAIEKDEPYVTEIINQLKTNLQRQFFRGTFSPPKETRKLSDEDFAMLYLYSHLSSLNLRDEILELEPIKYSHSEDKYTRVYTLTDSGFAFYKLLNIVETYCSGNKDIMKTGLCSLNTYNNKKVLDSGIYISYG